MNIFFRHRDRLYRELQDDAILALLLVRFVAPNAQTPARLLSRLWHLRANYESTMEGETTEEGTLLQPLFPRRVVDVAPRSNAEILRTRYPNLSVPDEYRCGLSLEIMTDPVFDPKTPEQKFERAWIEEHLSRKEEHPMTRQVLRICELQSDTELKKEIDDYMAEIISGAADFPSATNSR